MTDFKKSSLAASVATTILKTIPARSRTIKAVFTGSENRKAALGFIRGQQYTLVVEHKPKVDGFIRITNQASPFQECEYESLLSFLDNWNKIERNNPFV